MCMWVVFREDVMQIREVQEDDDDEEKMNPHVS